MDDAAFRVQSGTGPSPADSDPDRIDDLTTLGRELDLLRRAAARGTRRAKVSIDDLARRLDIPRSTLHTYLTGRTLPPADVLDAIVIALGVRVSELRPWANAWFRVTAALDREPKRRVEGGPTLVARQLPRTASTLVGRDRELAEMDRLLIPDSATAVAEAVPLVAITGAGGVGKTSMAVAWAKSRGKHFPDGQLFCDLNGYGSAEPMLVLAALRDLLRAVGVASDRVPDDVSAAAGLWRTLTAQRCLLLVLDNAHDADQVRHLLPGAAQCAVVVTSRNGLAGLAVRDGAHILALSGLSTTDAMTLLAGRLDPVALATSPSDVSEILGYCGGLPLALLLVADRLRRDGGASAEALRSLAKDLTDVNSRLDALVADQRDNATNLSHLFAWSYDSLPTDAARLFRLLCTQPGREITTAGALALSGEASPQARQALGFLTDVHLLGIVSPGRYLLHDLVHAYGAELAGRLDPTADTNAALERLRDHYLYAAAGACDTLAPTNEPDCRPSVVGDARAAVQFEDRSAAVTWFDREIGTLLMFARIHEDMIVPLLSPIAARYLATCGRQQEAIWLHSRAATLADEAGDVPGQARALYNLGFACLRNGRLGEATDHLEQALRLAVAIGARETERRARNVLGLNAWQAGRFDGAREHLDRALALAADLQFPDGEAIALNNLGILNGKLGRNPEAADCFERAAEISRRTGYAIGEALALGNLGLILVRGGRHERAVPVLEEGLSLARESANRNGEGRILSSLGLAELRTGLIEAAHEHLNQALRITDETDDKMELPYILNSLGELALAQGELQSASRYHVDALGRAQADGDRYEQARAHDGLAAASGPGDQSAAEHRTFAAALRAELVLKP